MVNGELRVTGGDISDLVDRKNIEFLGFGEVKLFRDYVDKYTKDRIAYEVWFVTPFNSRRQAISVSATDKTLDSLTVDALENALKARGIYLSRAQIKSEEEKKIVYAGNLYLEKGRQ